MRLLVRESRQQPGRWSWWLFGDDGETRAWAGRTYGDHAEAHHAAELFMAASPTLRYSVELEAERHWGWRAFSREAIVATSAQNFATRSAAERAARAVRDGAISATGLLQSQ
jgi:hypothetical protein